MIRHYFSDGVYPPHKKTLLKALHKIAPLNPRVFYQSFHGPTIVHVHKARDTYEVIERVENGGTMVDWDFNGDTIPTSRIRKMIEYTYMNREQTDVECTAKGIQIGNGLFQGQKLPGYTLLLWECFSDAEARDAIELLMPFFV